MDAPYLYPTPVRRPVDRDRRMWRFLRTAAAALVVLVFVLPVRGSAPSAQHPLPVWANRAEPVPGLLVGSISAVDPHAVWVSAGAGNPESAAYGMARWNGAEWSRETGPGGKVVAISPNDVWSIGPRETYHFDGRTWVQVVTEQREDERVAGVDAASSTDVWAVGSTASMPGSDPEPAFTARWNGRRWERIAGPTYREPELYDVEAIAADDAWAVGSDRRDGAVIAHWNGQEWRNVPLPEVPTASSLHVIARVGPKNIWAVGSADGGPLAVHYDGESWRMVPFKWRTERQWSWAFTAAAPDGRGGVWMGLERTDLVEGRSGGTRIAHWGPSTGWTTMRDPTGSAESSWRVMEQVPGTATVWAAGCQKITSDYCGEDRFIGTR